jgi:beta-phosphoglucomutase family hydrolase
MSGTGALVTLSHREYDAVLFDMDGVLTQTASVHARAWKKLFDQFLQKRAAQSGEPFVPFDIDTDYRRYVDGKPRYDGVVSFLASRDIQLPFDTPSDDPNGDSTRVLGRLKDEYFLREIQEHGAQPYEAAIELVQALKAQGIAMAVVTSSVNGATVLQSAGIAQLFDARVDGVDIANAGLKGKPAPDAFLEAARRLKVEPSRAVVVEDAIAGVQAARAGHFGLVIGVDRVGQSHALRKAGAHVVVNHLGQVEVTAHPPSEWSLIYDEFDPAREGMRESLCALGNGYFEIRGAAPWTTADDVHYPGTYLAGGYNRLRTDIAGRVVENEDLVNLPHALALSFRIEDAEWFDLREVDIHSYRQELDLSCGMLLRSVSFTDTAGRRSTLKERRLVSMHDMHLCALEVTLIAENWSGDVSVCSAIDGRVVNAGAKLYRKFNNRHLEPLASEAIDEDSIWLQVRTNQSDIRIGNAARTRAFVNHQAVQPQRRTISKPGYVAQEFKVRLVQGATLAVEKIVALHTSYDHAISESGLAARKAIARAGSFESMMAPHAAAWQRLWRRFDIHLRPVAGELKLNVPMLLRLNMFHLLQAVSPNSVGLDIGVPARGWTGEAYQGHIFWDELFIFPFINFRTPQITRSLLMYRYRRLGEARQSASAAGLRGAMFPWQSGSDGQEETQALNFNHRSGRWVPDNSFRQRHVGSAIAYNVWQYYQVTHDTEFMHFHGAELMLEIALFWSSLAVFNEQRGRYEIRGVMGPDEYHERYPDSREYGLNNNAYTNVMAVWVLLRARDALQLLPDIRRIEVMRTLKLDANELARWDEITRKMFVPFHEDGLISQFEGYERLAEFDWEGYRRRYGNIQRLDLILEAENDSTNRYKLAKQADVLMLFYVFSADELLDLLKGLGYEFDSGSIPRNVAYYDARSSHGSTLSRVVHSWVLARSDRARSMTYFAEALQSDVSDIQQGTTAEGVHLGAMAGTVDLLQRVATGIEVTNDVLRFDPRLPQGIARMDMRIRYRGHTLDLRLTRETLTVRGRERGIAPIKLAVKHEIHEFMCGTTRSFSLN